MSLRVPQVDRTITRGEFELGDPPTQVRVAGGRGDVGRKPRWVLAQLGVVGVVGEQRTA